jgi:serine/threonine protein kinase
MRFTPGNVIREKYTLEKLMGVGASGEVWRAKNAQQIVAIKFMNQNLLSSEKAGKHRERLEREVNALGLLNHPHIPKLFDYDLDFERPFIVMEFISSPSYETLLGNGEMMTYPVDKRLNALAKIAEALTLAHQNGIIHRDIKPGNMHGIDHPYLLDFSVALGEDNLEHTNFNVGTTLYMTPGGEQPDRLADNYSFAVVTYEVLFGMHPILAIDDPARTQGTYGRILAFQKLLAGQWFKPTQLTREQLPKDLRGADLKHLDDIFSRAFIDRKTRYVHLSEFMNELYRAIMTVSTQAFLEKYTRPPVMREERTEIMPRPASIENFTMLEVESEKQGSSPTPSPDSTDSQDNKKGLFNRVKKLFGGKE